MTMSIFEEESWDVAPEVNKLDDGLFGKLESDNKKTEGAVRTPAKLKRGQRGLRGPTERSQKWKNKDVKTKDKTIDATPKSEGGVSRTPGKHKRGKRGKNLWKKRGEEEEQGNDSQKEQNEADERKKKLKLKKKMQQSKTLLPAGKSPRNKYKHLAIKREEQLNSNNSKDTESGVDVTERVTSHKEKLKKPKAIEEQTPLEAVELETQTGKVKKGKKSKSDTKGTSETTLETHDLEEPRKKKAKKEKLANVADDTDESTDQTTLQKKKTKKRKETNSAIACTPIESKKKQNRTVEVISEGLFSKAKSNSEDDSPSGDTQLEPSKRKKKKKERLLQAPLDDVDEPTKVKKKKKLKTENPSDIENETFVDNYADKTDKLKKKKGKSEEDEMVESNHPSPQIKSPFHISKLKHVLDRNPAEAVTGKKRRSEALEESPKAKLKKSEPLSLRERMQVQLSGARFRFINEQLYTCTGEEALQLMQTDPDAFKVYHDGFTSQVEKWPENPVNRVIKFVKARPDAVVADLGCGDAKLAQSVSNTVHSFDLVAVNEHITVCDITQLPLSDDSIDVAVFCLALMGTNFVDFICEANRTLKTGGTLIIAEVVSRFEKVGAFVRKMAKLGFELSKKDDSNKMFIWFEFTKTSEAPSAERRPHLELTPCIYKKR